MTFWQAFKEQWRITVASEGEAETLGTLLGMASFLAVAFLVIVGIAFLIFGG